MEVRYTVQHTGHLQDRGGIFIPGCHGQHPGAPSAQLQPLDQPVPAIGSGKSGQKAVCGGAQRLQFRGKTAAGAQQTAECFYAARPLPASLASRIPPEKPQIFAQRRPEQPPALLFQRIGDAVMKVEEGERLAHDPQRPSLRRNGADVRREGFQLRPTRHTRRSQCVPLFRRSA